MSKKPENPWPTRPDTHNHYVAVYGKWHVKHLRGNEVIQESSSLNIITTNGKEALMSVLASSANSSVTNTFRYVACGTGTLTEAASQTALQTELTRVSATVSYVSGAIYQVTATFPTGTAGTVTEYGLFNTSTAGTMFCRDVESPIEKATTDEITATLQIVLS